jgi:hypothetical protein
MTLLKDLFAMPDPPPAGFDDVEIEWLEWVAVNRAVGFDDLNDPIGFQPAYVKRLIACDPTTGQRFTSNVEVTYDDVQFNSRDALNAIIAVREEITVQSMRNVIDEFRKSGNLPWRPATALPYDRLEFENGNAYRKKRREAAT